MKEQIEKIAQAILLDLEDEICKKNGTTNGLPQLYPTNVEVGEAFDDRIIISYIEDWGQSGSEPKILYVTQEDFCDPKYLLDNI